MRPSLRNRLPAADAAGVGRLRLDDREVPSYVPGRPAEGARVARPILFLSDLGVRDEFVGVCHSVIATIAPDAAVIDLSHGVPPTNVQAGAMTFRDCIAFAPQDGVLLGVVDPGVGTDRKAIAVETASGRILVGPDNGLLSLAWEAAGGPTRAFEITAPDVLLQPVSSVFHGRDVFAPAAAHLAAGRPPEDLGPELKTDELMTLTLPEADILTGEIRAEVLDVDRFGNVRLNVRPADLPAAGLGWFGAQGRDDRCVGPRRPRVDLRGGRDRRARGHRGRVGVDHRDPLRGERRGRAGRAPGRPRLAHDAGRLNVTRPCRRTPATARPMHRRPSAAPPRSRTTRPPPSTRGTRSPAP